MLGNILRILVSPPTHSLTLAVPLNFVRVLRNVKKKLVKKECETHFYLLLVLQHSLRPKIIVTLIVDTGLRNVKSWLEKLVKCDIHFFILIYNKI